MTHTLKYFNKNTLLTVCKLYIIIISKILNSNVLKFTNKYIKKINKFITDKNEIQNK